MMQKLLSTTAVLFLLFSAAAQTKPKAPVKAPAVKPAFKNLVDSFSYAIGYSIANNLQNQGISTLNFDVVKKAMAEAYAKKTAFFEPGLMNAVMEKQMNIFAEKAAAPEIAKGRNFLNENKKRSGVKTLASGLQYEVIKKSDTGTIHPKETDTVVVNYIGSLISGKEFENSYTYGTPAEFALNRVIGGWTQAIQLMTVGDRWKVYIPTELAYYLYPTDPNTIPPGAALIFEISLERIKPSH